MKLRIWPAVVLLLVALAAKLANPLYLQQTEPKIPVFRTIVFGQVICCGAIVLWWLFFTRAPWSDRILGFAGAAVASAVAWFASDKKQTQWVVVRSGPEAIAVNLRKADDGQYVADDLAGTSHKQQRTDDAARANR
jgi:hypothetical protein